MAYRSFQHNDLIMVRDALDIAEDATNDYYKFSTSQWKRSQYDVKTLQSLKRDEISHHAFALLSKQERRISRFESKTKGRDFYFICLQDHRILEALKRDENLGLLSILVYVLTHELIHVVRFCNFLQRYNASQNEEIDREERVVHSTTFEILQDISMPELDYVLDVYKDHRVCEMSDSQPV